MIPRVLKATADAEEAFVVRLSSASNDDSKQDAVLIARSDSRALYSYHSGLLRLSASIQTSSTAMSFS
jgi:hypothetical protein